MNEKQAIEIACTELNLEKAFPNSGCTYDRILEYPACYDVGFLRPVDEKDIGELLGVLVYKETGKADVRLPR